MRLYTKKRHKIKAIVAALKEGRLLDTACQEAGIARATLYRWRQANARLNHLIETAVNRVDDMRVTIVEESLFDKARAGNIIAMIVYLTNRAPHRWKNNRDRYAPESAHEKQLRESNVEILSDADDKEAAKMLQEFTG